MSTKASSYIPEIDTLRAVAVVLVVLFHAWPAIAPGGFIGVDVFFVISGFVIARSYLFPLIEGEKTLKDFYIARFRRLAPAAFFLLLVTSVAAMIILLPDRLMSYAWSLIAQPVYLQNFVFWYEGDYFDRALTKPLLHTWSLAVEEQFYILWAFAILLFRRLRWLIWPSLLVFAALSIMGGLLVEPRSPKTVFFMLPTRIWEFALGIMAYLATRHVGKITSKAAIPFPYLCLLVIFWTGFAFNEASSFPGPQAWIACVCTAVILFLFDRMDAELPGMKLPPVLYTGRISYGFYLWHWPPVSLFFLYLDRLPSAVEAGLLVALAYLLAMFSYHFVEQPVRRRSLLDGASNLLRAVLGGSLVTAAVAGFIFISGGLLFLYSTDVRQFLEARKDSPTFRCGKVFSALNPASEMCPINNKNNGDGVLVLGDSHADVLKRILGEKGGEHGLEVFLTTRNCDLGRYGSTAFCNNRVFDRVIREARSNGVTNVLAISFWDQGRFTVESFERDVKKLLGAGFDVTLMEVVPHDPGYDPRKRARLAIAGGELDYKGITLQDYADKTRETKDVFSTVASKAGERVTIVSPSDYFCPDGQCSYHENGKPLYFDSNHLSVEGVRRATPMLDEVFRRINNGN